MGKGEDALDVLRSIDGTLKQLLSVMRVAKPKETASDADLDGQYGDPIVKASDPRDWTGPSQKGKRFSECSSEYLELVASRLDWFAENAEKEGKTTTTGKPVAPYNRRDAARARGWAARVRAGRVPTHHATNGNGNGGQWDEPASQPAADGFGTGGFEDDIPFAPCL